MKIIRLLGSLYFAIFLIATLAILLIVSTSLESVYGIPFAQEIFYTAKWFDAFLSLLWINIFCATLTRWPFKKKHTGFVITHIGILTFLIGALIARIGGVEGQITLFETENWNYIRQEGHELTIALDEYPDYVFKLPDHPGKKRLLKIPNSEAVFYYHRLIDNAKEQSIVKEGDDSVNRAVRLALSSERVGLNQELWLIENDPHNPYSNRIQMGPAQFMLQIEKPEEEAPIPYLILSDKDGEILSRIPLDALEVNAHTDPLPINKTDLVIKELKYYPQAKVIQNKLVNSPEDTKFNPAIELQIQNAEGLVEKHTRFMLFPNFESLHGKPSLDTIGIHIKLDVPFPDKLKQPEPPSLVITYTQDNQWKYQSTSKSGGMMEGLIEKGSTYETGWMDMKFTILDIITKGTVSKEIIQTPMANSGQRAAKITYEDQNKKMQDAWVFSSKPSIIETTEGKAKLSLGVQSLKIPFYLKLVDFRKIDYPGTQSASEFESDVILFDPNQNLTLQKTISMNKPLDHAGYRIFQSSYIQDPQLGEASVFTVAKNPGIPFIYIGGCIILLGVFILFYLRPLSSVAFPRKKTLSMLFLLTATALCGTLSAAHAEDFSAIKQIPIQHKGRIKSFEAYSKQTLRLVTRKGRWEKQASDQVLLKAHANPENVADWEWIAIDLKDLKKELGLDESRHHFSYSELGEVVVQIEALARKAKEKRDQDIRPTKIEQKAQTLYNRFITVHNIISGLSFTVIPHSSQETWLPLNKGSSDFSESFQLILQNYKDNNASLFTQEIESWTELIADHYDSSKINLELLYYQLLPFQRSWVLYFLSFMLLYLFKKSSFLKTLACLAFVLAFGLHLGGLILRVLILSRPPVSNMYESMVFMNWVVALAAIAFFILRRSTLPLLAGSVVSALVMIYAALLPMDPSMDVLVPVLRSNYWLTIHVMTIVSSYGLFGLAMGLGHRHLLLQTANRFTAQSQEESGQLILRIIQFGVILLGTGTVLGGVWANESWGRFWGWDPKETWALITFLGYLIVIHLRMRKQLSDFGLALSTIFGFLLVLMTWYGVNFVLGRGLHSYGHGSGGMVWILVYLIVEALFIAYILFRGASSRNQSGT